MQAVLIFLLSIAAAVTYGIVHDQVTARVCVEYFTIGHPSILGGTQDPTLRLRLEPLAGAGRARVLARVNSKWGYGELDSLRRSRSVSR